jgi:hypothetical protein
MKNLSWGLRCLSEGRPHLYVSLAAVYRNHTPPPNAICIKCCVPERPTKSSSDFVSLSTIFVMTIILFFYDTASLSSVIICFTTVANNCLKLKSTESYCPIWTISIKHIRYYKLKFPQPLIKCLVFYGTLWSIFIFRRLYPVPVKFRSYNLRILLKTHNNILPSTPSYPKFPPSFSISNQNYLSRLSYPIDVITIILGLCGDWKSLT